MDDKRYWVGFNLVRGIGAVRLQALIDHFGDAASAWQGDAGELRAAGLGSKVVERLLELRSTLDLDKLWERILAQGIRILTWHDQAYPQHLKEIEQPPPVLYVRGELLPEDDFAVAIVGTRRVSPYGRQVTEELAAFLGANGITVVSGLARGVDAIAHAAALRAGGRTVAVLGSGVDRIYPPENRALAEQIIARGAVISDYPVGTAPESTNFPPRNRIISGLSLAVVVIEAGETSGALITAEFAAEQGREVFAVPGQHPGSAKQRHEQVDPERRIAFVDASGPDAGSEPHARQRNKKSARRMLPADEVEAKLMMTLDQRPHACG